MRCLNLEDFPGEVAALVDAVQCPLSWGEAWRVIALGLGGLVVVCAVGWVWWTCRGGARFQPLGGSTPILRRGSPPRGRMRQDATREDLEETGSIMTLEESRGRQVRKYKMKKKFGIGKEELQAENV